MISNTRINNLRKISHHFLSYPPFKNLQNDKPIYNGVVSS